MRILHISYAKNWGGGEQQMIDLIHALNALNTTNSLVCFKDSALHNYVVKNNLEYVLIENRKLKPLKTIIEQSNADILHIHTGSFIKDYILLTLFYNIDLACIYTINGIMRRKSFFSKLKYNYSKIHAIHFVSEAAKQHFKEEVAFKSSYKKLHTIHDGIQVSKKESQGVKRLTDLLQIYEESYIIGNIANHTRAKNLMSFLRTADYLINKKGFKNFHFVQIGKKTKFTPEFQSFILDKNLESNLHILGFIEDAENYLPQFNTLLITSNREGLPLVIMEAFKHQVPVVSTSAGGIPEAIVTGENGFLSEIDDEEALGNQILELYEKPALKEEFTKKSYKLLVDKFSFMRMGKETLELYKKII